MNTVRDCGCKGHRSCLECEEKFNINKTITSDQLKDLEAYSYCPACSKIFPSWDTEKVMREHPFHNNVDGQYLPGIYIMENFITSAESEDLVRDIDFLPWANSQSGRRKQNYGPKTNFKKRKLRLGDFSGFPLSTQFIQKRFAQIDVLKDFQTIEQCSLEYDPKKGASIDPHIDDCWIWGERVVTVNCLGDAVLTMQLFDSPKLTEKYNLHLVDFYKEKLRVPFLNFEDVECFQNKVIRVPMPQ